MRTGCTMRALRLRRLLFVLWGVTCPASNYAWLPLAYRPQPEIWLRSLVQHALSAAPVL